jgi:molybdopterin molybdotransferase
MITPQRATEMIQQHLPPKERESVPLSEASERVIAEDVFAPEPSPRYTQSAMDGFAARWADVESLRAQEPVNLHLIGESCAGVPFSDTVCPGQAVRISTGAMLPKGSDTVLPIEDTEVAGNIVRVRRIEKQNQHVRFEGEEIQKGDFLIENGSSLNPPRIALLAAMGIAQVSVYRIPEAAILTTGTELVPHDHPTKPWQIRDSNRLMLTSAVQNDGAKVVFTEHVDDGLTETRTVVEGAAKKSGVILVSGGVSVGSHDYVKAAIEQIGFRTVFWQVKQKPGKPFLFAKKEKQLLFGLPGNPVAAFMCYTYYIQPIIRSLASKPFTWPLIEGQLRTNVQNPSGKTNFVRVRLEPGKNGSPDVVPLQKQGSHMLTSITNAEGFIILHGYQTSDAGNLTDVHLFS